MSRVRTLIAGFVTLVVAAAALVALLRSSSPQPASVPIRAELALSVLLAAWTSEPYLAVFEDEAEHLRGFDLYVLRQDSVLHQQEGAISCFVVDEFGMAFGYGATWPPRQLSLTELPLDQYMKIEPRITFP